MKKRWFLLPAIVAIMLVSACVGIAPAAIPPAEAPMADTPPEQTSSAAQLQASTVSPDPTRQLIDRFEGPPETDGEVLFLFGQVLDANGSPVPDALVEIWQTDSGGFYDHPRDPATDSRDRSFQFYGSTTSDAEGWYAFRTIVPGRYEPRPRHIHYKVKQDGVDLLTSQFYFSDDIAEVEGEGMFKAVGEHGDLLLIQLVQGDEGLLANGSIVMDTGIGAGTLPLTPSQAEGPYYPVVSPSGYDNDLLTLP